MLAPARLDAAVLGRLRDAVRRLFTGTASPPRRRPAARRRRLVDEGLPRHRADAVSQGNVASDGLELDSAYVAVRSTSRRSSRPPSITTALYHVLRLGGRACCRLRDLKRRRRARVFSVAVSAVAGEGRCFAVVLALLSDVAPLSRSRRCSSWPSRAGAEAVVLLVNASARRRFLLAARAARRVRLEHVLAINANPCSTHAHFAPP